MSRPLYGREEWAGQADQSSPMPIGARAMHKRGYARSIRARFCASFPPAISAMPPRPGGAWSG